ISQNSRRRRNTVHPGHQVPRGALPSRYSCSATAKSPSNEFHLIIY
ncbi:hypothetical protein TSAR_016046, partial [Trichomalopsis sarcophagae]